jgi:GntR family transcriptional regulator
VLAVPSGRLYHAHTGDIGAGMEIVLDLDAGVPLFSQLVAQIKQAVSADELAPGDPLPSIRQLATDLEVDKKTVAKAYRLLERDAIVQSKGYRGTFVHPEAKAHCDVDLKAWTVEQLGTAVSTLKAAGVTDSEIRIAFGTVMNGKNE